LLARFRIVPHHPLPFLLGHLYLTAETVSLGPRPLCSAAAANQGQRRRNVGVFEAQADRRFICVDRNGLFFTHALLRGHCFLVRFLAPAFGLLLTARLAALTECLPLIVRFGLRGRPGSIWEEYTESQT
jgi:hypothetical protein